MNFYFKCLRKSFVFSGRARRKELWVFVLINSLIAASLFILEKGLGLFPTLSNEVSVLYIIYCSVSSIPAMAAQTRRLHDIGRSGRWFLINLVPIVGPCVFFFWMCKDSTPGENEYGPNPKGGIIYPTASYKQHEEYKSLEETELSDPWEERDRTN